MVASLLALRPRPTALVCFNNSLARLAIRQLGRRGLRVPRDLSVFGIGGEEMEGLSCAQADWFAMGREAVRNLRRAGPPGIRLFPYQVVPGRTAGAPPRG